jgi:hypothetical protein
MKSGILDLLEPSGLSRPVKGTLYSTVEFDEKYPPISHAMRSSYIHQPIKNRKTCTCVSAQWTLISDQKTDI